MENTQTLTPEVALVPEPKAPAAPPSNAAPKRSREELVKEGWSPAELKLAEDAGEISPEAKKEPAAAPRVAKKEGEAEAESPEKTPEAAPIPKPGKPAGGIPDMVLTPDQEAQFVKLFPEGSPQHGLYFYGKKERRERQRLAQENEELKRQLKDRTLVKDEPAPEGEDAELDKPLTARMLRELQDKEEKKRQQAHEQQRDRVKVVTAAQKDQEDYAKTVYTDFLPTVELAKDVMQNFETLFPEKWKQEKAVSLMQGLQRAALEADRFGLEDYHAAHIAHEIGRMHPKYGKASAPAGEEPKSETPANTGPKNPKAPSSQSLATLKRIQENTQRRPSSASVPSGDGGRALVPGEVTAEMLDGMTSKDREAFRDANPTEYAELMRG